MYVTALTFIVMIIVLIVVYYFWWWWWYATMKPVPHTQSKTYLGDHNVGVL